MMYLTTIVLWVGDIEDVLRPALCFDHLQPLVLAERCVQIVERRLACW